VKVVPVDEVYQWGEKPAGDEEWREKVIVQE
jgi:hypothetical protein